MFKKCDSNIIFPSSKIIKNVIFKKRCTCPSSHCVDHAHIFCFQKTYTFQTKLVDVNKRGLLKCSKFSKDKHLIEWEFDALNDINIFEKKIITKTT